MTVRVIPHLPINLPPPTIPTKNHRQKRGAILHLTNPINLRTNPNTSLPVHLPLINHPHPHRINPNPLQNRHTNRLTNLPHRINPIQNHHINRLTNLPHRINPIQNRRIDLPHHQTNPIQSPEVLLIQNLHDPHDPHVRIPKAQAVPPRAPLPGRHLDLLQYRLLQDRLKRNKK